MQNSILLFKCFVMGSSGVVLCCTLLPEGCSYPTHGMLVFEVHLWDILHGHHLWDRWSWDGMMMSTRMGLRATNMV